jgi:CubicO group peptidase (beta-lactamase class C family)
MKKSLSVFALLSLLIVFAGCKKDRVDYNYKIPEVSDDGWEVCSSDEVGISSGTLSKMMDRLNSVSNHNIHDILIFRNGKLLFEEYFRGYLYIWDTPGSNGDLIQYVKETNHFLASVSKTITSVLFGIAVKKGFIENLDDKVVDIFPDYADILTDAKAEITLKQLLTMSSGLAWDESTSYEDPANDVKGMFDSDDPLAYVLSRPLLYSPGTQFLYNSGGTNVLGAVIEKFTGKSLFDFAKEYLFDPLGIEQVEWHRISPDYYFASGGISLKPRDLAKIGYLFLNNGYWGEDQIISPEWISESVQEHIITQGRTIPMARGYGYQWWLEDFKSDDHTYSSFFAAGWGDQYMFIFPQEEMIIVFNGGNYLKSGSISPFYLVPNFILDSLQ